MTAQHRPAERQGRGPATETKLRGRLRLNAGVSFTTGSATLVLAPSLSRALGVDASGLVRLTGGALVVFAVDLVVLSRARRRHLFRGAGIVVVADALWVLATAVALATATIPVRGVVVLVATGALVAALATVQWRALRDVRADELGTGDRLEFRDQVPELT